MYTYIYTLIYMHHSPPGLRAPRAAIITSNRTAIITINRIAINASNIIAIITNNIIAIIAINRRAHRVRSRDGRRGST